MSVQVGSWDLAGYGQQRGDFLILDVIETVWNLAQIDEILVKLELGYAVCEDNSFDIIEDNLVEEKVDSWQEL